MNILVKIENNDLETERLFEEYVRTNNPNYLTIPTLLGYMNIERKKVDKEKLTVAEVEHLDECNGFRSWFDHLSQIYNYDDSLGRMEFCDKCEYIKKKGVKEGECIKRPENLYERRARFFKERGLNNESDLSNN